MRQFNLLAPLALVASFALASCITTTNGVQRNNRDVSKWLEPTPTLRQDLDDQSARLPFTHNRERVDLIRWFARVGEPAYPWLLEMAADERENVASAAIAALGSTGDHRLIEEMKALPWPTPDENFGQALERARALLRLGDWSEIPILIRGLESDRPYLRALCSKTLNEATNSTHGFDPLGESEGRAVAVAEWKTWWQARSGDSLLEASARR